MSHSVGIEIVVVGMAGLIKAVVECGLACVEERQTFTNDQGEKHTVDLVVTDKDGAKVGVKVDAKTKVATFVPHDCKGTKGVTLARKVAQRYARAKLIEELERKGYKLGKEEKQADGTIKLTASRWR